MKDRQIAGYELAKRIQAFGYSYAEFKIVLLAHSHGGNIIRYAISYPGVQEYVNKIIYLGTPFFSVTPKDKSEAIFNQNYNHIKNTIFAISFLLMCLIYAVLYLFYFKYVSDTFSTMLRAFTFPVHKSVSEQIQPGLDTPNFYGGVGLIGLRSKIRRWDAQC